MGGNLGTNQNSLIIIIIRSRPDVAAAQHPRPAAASAHTCRQSLRVRLTNPIASVGEKVRLQTRFCYLFALW
jgi:hypothetical protein